MADPAEPQQPKEQRDLGKCGWCDKDAVTLLFVEGSKKAKKRKTAPVCAEHEAHFIQGGASSERSEMDDAGPKNAKRYVIR
jgi:hypothetical protein